MRNIAAGCTQRFSEISFLNDNSQYNKVIVDTAITTLRFDNNIHCRYMRRSRVSDRLHRYHRRSQRGGGLGGLASPQRMRKNIKASLVNLTLNMSYKNDKKYQMSSPDSFYRAQNAPKPRWGSLRRSPDPPRSMPSSSRTRRGSQAPLNTKSWLRQWSVLQSVIDALVYSNYSRRSVDWYAVSYPLTLHLTIYAHTRQYDSRWYFTAASIQGGSTK